MKAWTLRAASAADTDFLYSVYASTRHEELALVGWNAEQIEAFLQSQFALQDRHYRQCFAAARYDIVLVEGIPAGRLYVHRGTNEMRVLDIALLPPFRRHGLGRALLTALLVEARQAGLRVVLHVERSNPALTLYQQLGFQLIDDQQGVYLEMDWHAPQPEPMNRPREAAGIGA